MSETTRDLFMEWFQRFGTTLRDDEYEGVIEALVEHDRQVAERAWDDALAHVDQLSDPARTIEIAPDRELITLQDVQQAIGDNPYRTAKGAGR